MKMRFLTDKYYDDKTTPIFTAGKVYEVSEENGWAARWLKRGGIEVTETPAKTEATPSNDQIPPTTEITEPTTPVDPALESGVEETLSTEDALAALDLVEPAPAAEVKEEVVNPAPKKQNRGSNKK